MIKSCETDLQSGVFRVDTELEADFLPIYFFDFMAECRFSFIELSPLLSGSESVIKKRGLLSLFDNFERCMGIDFHKMDCVLKNEYNYRVRFQNHIKCCT